MNFPSRAFTRSLIARSRVDGGGAAASFNLGHVEVVPEHRLGVVHPLEPLLERLAVRGRQLGLGVLEDLEDLVRAVEPEVELLERERPVADRNASDGSAPRAAA